MLFPLFLGPTSGLYLCHYTDSDSRVCLLKQWDYPGNCTVEKQSNSAIMSAIYLLFDKEQ